MESRESLLGLCIGCYDFHARERDDTCGAPHRLLRPDGGGATLAAGRIGAIIWLRQALLSVRYGFWFLPSILVIIATLLAIVLIELSERTGPHAFDQWPRLFGAGAAGARGLLETIASSMVTVAGVVFSITLVALSQASSQYSSRVLRKFMSDRGNQVVLGVFVGIFVYCLIVLRTIRGGDEGAFVPSLAVFGALMLGFVGIAVLIYYIHHISRLIQASHIVASIMADAVRAIDIIYSEELAAGEADADPEPANFGADWRAAPAKSTGYLQSVDVRGLAALACERDSVVRMESRTGQFVVEGMPIVSMLGVSPTADEERTLSGLYAIGRQRTIEQDPEFGIRQIVDVALKALSPGINDTTTAVMCIDHLSAILVRLSGRRIDSCHRTTDGIVKVLCSGPSWSSLVGEAFDQIRQNASGNVAVLDAMLRSIALVGSCTSPEARRRVLLEHALAIADLARRSVVAHRDRERVERSVYQAFERLGVAQDS